MKKAMPFLLAAAVVITLFCGLLWLNNIESARKSYEILFSGSGSAAEAARQPGFFGWLDWATLDLSTISTLIPFFGMLCLTLGIVRIRRGKPVLTENFPFFHSYDRINIALGLIGTIWGIIIIGFYKPEDINVANLMMCLHTALFSTMVAVVWVSVLLPLLVTPLMRKLAGEKAAGAAAAGEDDNLFELVDKLSVAAAAVSKEFAASNEQLRNFNGRLRNAAEELNECSLNLSAMLHRLTGTGDQWQKEQARQVEILGQTAKMVESVSNVQSQLTAQLEKLQRDNATLQAQNAALRSTNSELSESASVAGAENIKLKTALEQIKGAFH
ncbi:MAG: MotA/TolQ/ExbB proton channel family protein [Victivallaceae bacterium]|nr:MotA/TolQ/ExbB proton channel family protein [Victivallaceae bacterium]